MTEENGFIFQLSIGQKSEFPQLPVYVPQASLHLLGYIGEVWAWSLHQEKQN